MADFTLTQEQYESLIAFARKAVENDAVKLTALDRWLRLIEKQNGIERDFLWVQWQELGGDPIPGAFPDNYPPELRKSIELISRKIAKVDVEKVIEQYANEPTNVLVTRDPAGIVGWTAIDDFFIT